MLPTLAPLVKEGKVRVTQDSRGVSVEINASVLFDPGEARLAREADLGAATVQRIKDQGANFRIDAVASTAAALSVEPWQLLVPDINPDNMPRLDQRLMTPQANDLAVHLDRISDPAIRQRAYAAALVVISLAADPPGPEPRPPHGP